MAEPKPSFFSSVVSGIKGFFKGALSGGAVGAVAGAAIGSVVAMFTGGFGLHAIGIGALAGTKAGAVIAGSIGASAGVITGVIKSRETDQPSVDDIANVAKISMMQGIQIGQAQAQAQGAAPQIESPQEVTTKWREAETQRALARNVPGQPQLG